MARTVITPVPLWSSSSYYPTLPVTAGSADLTETAVDDPTDRYAPLTDGKTVVIAHNTDVGAHTITIGSAPDSFNRPGDVSAYSIAAGKIARFGPFKTAGWSNGGNLDIDVSSPLVRLAVVNLP